MNRSDAIRRGWAKRRQNGTATPLAYRYNRSRTPGGRAVEHELEECSIARRSPGFRTRAGIGTDDDPARAAFVEKLLACRGYDAQS